MVLTWLIGPLLDLVSGLLSGLPTGSLPWVTSGFGSIGSWLVTEAGFAGQFLPVSIMAGCAAFVCLVFLPALFVYELAQWGYRELPDIFGFGPS
jgi:hypothetical protein